MIAKPENSNFEWLEKWGSLHHYFSIIAEIEIHLRDILAKIGIMVEKIKKKVSTQIFVH